MNETLSSSPTQLNGHCRVSVAVDSRDLHQKRWPKEAHILVANYLKRLQPHMSDGGDQRGEMKAIITQLVALTGYSRERCWRFARRLGANGKQAYREWTRSDQQRLLDLISRNPACEVAKIMRRSPGSIRAMLHRLGASAQMGRDWFTMYTLAEALHTRSTQIQSWVDRGWLKTRIVETGRLRREIIEADAFAEFCKQHTKAVVGRRLRADRLDFVKDFVFPPSHVELLPVRGPYRKTASKENSALQSPRTSDQALEEDQTEDSSGLAAD